MLKLNGGTIVDIHTFSKCLIMKMYYIIIKTFKIVSLSGGLYYDKTKVLSKIDFKVKENNVCLLAMQI